MPQATAVSPQALIEAAKAPLLAYNEKDWDKARSLLTPDFVYDEVPSGRKTEGVDAAIALFQGWAEAFPDSKGSFHSAFAGGNSVVMEVTWKGTHKGVLHTPAGPVQPTGKSIAVRACVIMELQGEKPKVQRHYFDMATMLQQLGLQA